MYFFPQWNLNDNHIQNKTKMLEMKYANAISNSPLFHYM